MSRVKAKGLAAVTVILVVMAGCMEAPQNSSIEPRDFQDEYPEPALPTFPTFPIHPAVVFELENEGYVNYTAIFEDREPMARDLCSVSHNAPQAYIVQFDMHGFVWEKNYRFDYQDREAFIQIPVEGTPPFILAGDRSICMSRPGGNTLDGVVKGERMWRLPGVTEEDMGNPRTSSLIPLKVPLGETSQRGTWGPDRYDWRMEHVWLESREGVRNGNLSLYNEAGELIRKFSFPTLESARLEGAPTLLHPGTYTIELELDRPAVESTEWVMGISTSRFGDEICRLLEIEWEICETPNR